MIVSTVGLLLLRSGTLPSATADINARSMYPWIIDVAIWVLCGVGALVTYLKVSTTKRPHERAAARHDRRSLHADGRHRAPARA